MRFASRRGVLGAQFELGDQAAMHFVRAVGQAQHAGIGIQRRQRKIIRQAGAAVDLHRRIGGAAAPRIGAITLICEISLIAAFTPCVSISQAALSVSRRACSIAMRRSATMSRVAAEPDQRLAERDARGGARAHSRASARSAAPIARMQ